VVPVKFIAVDTKHQRHRHEAYMTLLKSLYNTQSCKMTFST